METTATAVPFSDLRFFAAGALLNRLSSGKTIDEGKAPLCARALTAKPHVNSREVRIFGGTQVL
jgi:hypothetical protein